MKKLFTLFLFILSLQMVSSQVFKYNAYAVAFYDYEKENWDPFEETQILISLNPDTSKLKIYSKETQAFDIITTHEKVVDEDGDETYRLFCEDQNGITCYVDFVVLKSQGRSQVYVRYKDSQYVYNITAAD